MPDSHPIATPTTLAELQARTITAASDLAARWLASMPGANEYVDAGWGVAVELRLLPSPPCLSLSFIDPADGMRYASAMRELK